VNLASVPASASSANGALNRMSQVSFAQGWYDPATGTFLQTDPIGSLDYINLYAYVGLEPGNGTDPTGMETVVVTAKRRRRDT
jgi:RHS repeat-associated protein